MIDGVGFLPAQIAKLSTQYPLHAVFLGCSTMTLERFDGFPGRSPGYASLPETLRRQIVEDVPHWSAFVRQEAEHYGYTYIDMSDDFSTRLHEAAAALIPGTAATADESTR